MLPASVSIAAGSSQATFTVNTTQVQTPVTVTISATPASGSSGSAAFQVQQIPICGPFLTSPVVMPLYVYSDDNDPRSHFVPSGWFGDTGDLSLTLADSRSQTGTTAIRIDYVPVGPQRFAGIFFQCGDFANNQNIGFDLSQARQVQFWARSLNAGAKAEFKVGGIQGSFPDTLPSTPTNPIVVDLGTDWRQFTIAVPGGSTQARVIGGFMFVTNTTQNPTGVSVLLDEIVWR
jgi:hypothetical protein